MNLPILPEVCLLPATESVEGVRLAVMVVCGEPKAMPSASVAIRDRRSLNHMCQRHCLALRHLSFCPCWQIDPHAPSSFWTIAIIPFFLDPKTSYAF